jgi:hypothetical protein
MDKHERPYKCEAPGCEKLQGFTYSGGLLRHQREVHKMHGGTKEPLYCPYENCKRNSGAGFTRKENRDEHVRRVHRRNTTDGVDLELVHGSKRDLDAVDSTDHSLVRDSDAPQTDSGAAVLVEDGIEVSARTTPNPTKRRRLAVQQHTYGNGVVTDGNIDTNLELKAEIKKLQDSNSFLLRQHQDLRKDYQALLERFNHLEQDIGRHILGSRS